VLAAQRLSSALSSLFAWLSNRRYRLLVALKLYVILLLLECRAAFAAQLIEHLLMLTVESGRKLSFHFAAFGQAPRAAEWSWCDPARDAGALPPDRPAGIRSTVAGDVVGIYAANSSSNAFSFRSVSKPSVNNP
jgi:hypothetical protein